MNAVLYQALVDAAREINAKSKEHGFYALRKVKAVSPNSDLETLIKVGDDLVLITKKMCEESK